MAKTTCLHFFRQFLCWLLFFQATRLIFVWWNREALGSLPGSELLALPFQSIYLDTAMTCYFMGMPWLLCSAALLTEKKGFLRINRAFTGLLVVLTSVLCIGELPIYDEWKTKLNNKAISMLADSPSEVVSTATNGQLFWGILAMAVLSVAGLWLFRKLAAGKGLEPKRRPWRWSLLFVLGVPGLLITGMRGGLQPIPIQVSDAYYSKHQVLNAASTNSIFHLMSSYVHSQHEGKPYDFMPDKEAEDLFFAATNPLRDSTVQVFTTQRPNIVLVILESWSCDVVEACGGYEGITPNFDRLVKQGFFFSNCYSSGLRSEQGMASILSAFPAQPRTSILRMPNKFQQLPCIVPTLDSAGYATSFLYGGQLSFGNIRSYLYFNGFDRIIEGKDYDGSIPQGKLGVADEHLFERQLAELSKERQPFFAAMFTLSSHSPYDMPMEEVLHWGGKEKGYLNSAFYADRCLGDFMEKARTTDWYPNTVFVLMADHGHGSPRNWSYFQPEFRKVPLLLYGEALQPQFRGVTDTLPAGQTDLAATILRQLGLPSRRYKYSSDLFNPFGKRLAFFTFDEGFGWVKPESRLCWRVKGDWTAHQNPEGAAAVHEQNLKEGKAYLQVLMREYFGF